jgi:hypothetical protein
MVVHIPSCAPPQDRPYQSLHLIIQITVKIFRQSPRGYQVIRAIAAVPPTVDCPCSMAGHTRPWPRVLEPMEQVFWRSLVRSHAQRPTKVRDRQVEIISRPGLRHDAEASA